AGAHPQAVRDFEPREDVVRHVQADGGRVQEAVLLRALLAVAVTVPVTTKRLDGWLLQAVITTRPAAEFVPANEFGGTVRGHGNVAPHVSVLLLVLVVLVVRLVRVPGLIAPALVAVVVVERIQHGLPPRKNAGARTSPAPGPLSRRPYGPGSGGRNR